MNFLSVRLTLQVDAAADLHWFYVHHLGLEETEQSNDHDLISLRVGKTVWRFAPALSYETPFYHFALLVPGNRFEAARAWLTERSDVLADRDTGHSTFEFDDWDALACYCLDPAGNIVEIIAHRGLGETDATGAFEPGEILGFSELGLVVPDKVAAASQLASETGLEVWDGELDDPERLVFLGERGRTLILSPPGRGWLPTRRPAELHPVDAVVTGTGRGVATIRGTKHRIESRGGL